MAEAARWIKALRELDPDSPSHWGEWGGECWVLDRLADREAAATCKEEFIAAHPDSVAAQRIRVETGSFESQIKVMKQLYEEEPGNDYRANQYANMLDVAGMHKETLKVIQQTHPQLLSDQPEVNGETTWPACLAILALQKLGRNEQANTLLDALEEGIADIRLIAGPGFTKGIENVEIAAMRGEKEKALDLLQRAIDQGWRFMWDLMPYMTTLNSIHQDPKFGQMMAELEADITLQREEFYANKDKPLF
jgi:tetratricopeptide (TPR) repeat protein